MKRRIPSIHNPNQKLLFKPYQQLAVSLLLGCQLLIEKSLLKIKGKLRCKP